MIIRPLPYFVVIFVLFGCGDVFRSTHELGPKDDQLNEVNGLVAGRTCTVILGDGTLCGATGVAIGRDSTTMNDTLSHRTITLPNSRIRQVVLFDHLRGGLDGMTLGAGVGLGVYAGGVLLGEQGNAANPGFLVIGALALPLGFVTGSIVGHRHDIDYLPAIADSAGAAAE